MVEELALFEYWIDVVVTYVSFRYPPPDECAKRRCVLGRCLEEKQVCDRVWDCQVSDIDDLNTGLGLRNTANICISNVYIEN